MPDPEQLRQLHAASAVAYPFAALRKEGKLTEASATFWADDIISVEPFPGPYAVLTGRDHVNGKVEYWSRENTIHSVAYDRERLGCAVAVGCAALAETLRGSASSNLHERRAMTIMGSAVLNDVFAQSVGA